MWYIYIYIKPLRLAFSLSMIPLRSVQVVTGINHLFLLISIVAHGMNVPQFDHSRAEGCFSVWLLQKMMYYSISGFCGTYISVSL